MNKPVVVGALCLLFLETGCAGSGARTGYPTVDCEPPRVLHDKELALWRSLMDAVQGYPSDCNAPAQAINDWISVHSDALQAVGEATTHCSIAESDDLEGARMGIILVSGGGCGEATPVFWAGQRLRKAMRVRRVPISENDDY